MKTIAIKSCWERPNLNTHMLLAEEKVNYRMILCICVLNHFSFIKQMEVHSWRERWKRNDIQSIGRPALSKLAEKSIFLEAGVDYELPSDQNLQHFGNLLKIGYSAAEQGRPIVILECLN